MTIIKAADFSCRFLVFLMLKDKVFCQPEIFAGKYCLKTYYSTVTFFIT